MEDFKPHNRIRSYEDETTYESDACDPVLLTYLATSRYGNFELSKGVRLVPGGIIPVEGFRVGKIGLNRNGDILRRVLISAAATRSKIQGLFMSLLGSLESDEVDVTVQQIEQFNVVGSSHIEAIDLTCLHSKLWEFEDQIIDDPSFALTMRNGNRILIFDPHKVSHIINPGKKQINILQSFDLALRPHMKFITEGNSALLRPEHSTIVADLRSALIPMGASDEDLPT